MRHVHKNNNHITQYNTMFALKKQAIILSFATILVKYHRETSLIDEDGDIALAFG